MCTLYLGAYSFVFFSADDSVAFKKPSSLSVSFSGSLRTTCRTVCTLYLGAYSFVFYSADDSVAFKKLSSLSVSFSGLRTTCRTVCTLPGGVQLWLHPPGGTESGALGESATFHP